MSVLMKKHPTEIQVNLGGKVIRYTNVPASKLNPILVSLKDYQEESIPWRELAKDRISAAGSESAHMVRSARQSANMTQVELATLLKMPQANLSQVETGKRSIGKSLAKKLAKIFNLDYRVFL
jgi:ribosome-binding protein aMBF1 (putative translation factor)